MGCILHYEQKQQHNMTEHLEPCKFQSNTCMWVENDKFLFIIAEDLLIQYRIQGVACWEACGGGGGGIVIQCYRWGAWPCLQVTVTGGRRDHPPWRSPERGQCHLTHALTQRPWRDVVTHVVTLAADDNERSARTRSRDNDQNAPLAALRGTMAHNP